MTWIQFGQPQHYVLELEQSASVSMRITAVVDGNSAVVLSCTDPEPNVALLTEQLARADYMRAIGAILVYSLPLCQLC